MPKNSNFLLKIRNSIEWQWVKQVNCFLWVNFTIWRRKKAWRIVRIFSKIAWLMVYEARFRDSAVCKNAGGRCRGSGSDFNESSWIQVQWKPGKKGASTKIMEMIFQFLGYHWLQKLQDGSFCPLTKCAFVGVEKNQPTTRPYFDCALFWRCIA